MSHELTDEKIGELHEESSLHSRIRWHDRHMDSRKTFIAVARAAYDLGKASTAQPGTGWTDDELRAAIHEAAVADGFSVSIDHLSRGDVVMDGEVTSFRRLLTALGIDHQPKPELPTEVGSVVYDAVDTAGNSYSVLTRDNHREWCGVDQEGVAVDNLLDGVITSFGGVLDLDKVRGDGDE